MNDEYDYQSIFDKYKHDVNIVTKSRNWYTQQILLMNSRNIKESKLFVGSKTVKRLMPGKLYLYYYDPKYKATLPFYDRFPLVFPYHADSNSFIGLNMHYLSYFFRIKLMTILMRFATNTKLNENTRLNYSWQALNGMAQHQLAEKAIHKYLIGHVKSTFIEIPANQWHTALMLPVERFVKSSKINVWGNL